MTPEIRRRLAVHEAGHAVVAVVLGAEVAWVDLDYRPGYAGGTMVREVDPHTDAVVALAGYEVSGGALAHAGETHDTVAARELVGVAGIPAATLEARRILAGHRDQVLAVAASLLTHGRLAGGRVVELVTGSRLPPGTRVGYQKLPSIAQMVSPTPTPMPNATPQANVPPS